jgi:predicted RNA-binding protein with PUA-like domain
MASSRPQQFWLMKSEPDCFSIHDLAKSPKQSTFWSGVRNYQARNFMKAMRLGDVVLFYHSSVDPPAVVGTAVVSKEAYADHTAWKKGDDHFDPKASPENPIWQMVDIKLEEVFPREIPLDELRGVKALEKMVLLQRGSRLSVQPVTAAEFKTITQLAHSAATKPKSTKSKSKSRS